ncbi:MAG TPA: NAD(P)-dependent oxidoreductase [Candidatus Limnocylindrales bacterium]|jgi:dTDP-4-dehydrorhamnose reductase|nr:NAD(P)-dependent oxidoreductase [Candidatus Limnocylindrales bacterium]
MRVAVTGSTGRLGSALVRALADAPFTGPSGPLAWTRAELDLDAPDGVDGALDRDRPEVIVHAAAWTDVDGCARDPDLAMRRNGVATGHLAIACAQRGIDLLVISTNEVFDGTRTDRRPYSPDDNVSPANAYGASKAAAEDIAKAAYVNRRGTVGIIRTAWLYGPPGPDFPRKIADAARRAASEGEALRVVGDEWGTPTYAADLADAIVELLAEDSIGGIHHLVAAGVASRADWARDVIVRLGIQVAIDEIPGSTWQRASTPPAWGALAPTPLPSGEPIRPWQQAMADYEPFLKRALAAAAG